MQRTEGRKLPTMSEMVEAKYKRRASWRAVLISNRLNASRLGCFPCVNLLPRAKYDGSETGQARH